MIDTTAHIVSGSILLLGQIPP
ncbi:hypothetical protein GYH30_045453, partial [Glycine max]